MNEQLVLDLSLKEALEKEDFESQNFGGKIQKSDFIFHLAGVNRANTEIEVYDKNNEINSTLLNYLIKKNAIERLIFTLLALNH